MLEQPCPTCGFELEITANVCPRCGMPRRSHAQQLPQHQGALYRFLGRSPQDRRQPWRVAVRAFFAALAAYYLGQFFGLTDAQLGGITVLGLFVGAALGIYFFRRG